MRKYRRGIQLELSNMWYKEWIRYSNDHYIINNWHFCQNLWIFYYFKISLPFFYFKKCKQPLGWGAIFAWIITWVIKLLLHFHTHGFHLPFCFKVIFIFISPNIHFEAFKSKILKVLSTKQIFENALLKNANNYFKSFF